MYGNPGGKTDVLVTAMTVVTLFQDKLLCHWIFILLGIRMKLIFLVLLRPPRLPALLVQSLWLLGQ